MENSPTPPANMWPAMLPQLGRSRWLPLLVGALILVIVVAIWAQLSPTSFTANFGTLTAIDIEQGRLDTPMPVPQGTNWISQGFVPHHNGLSEIEVTLLRYSDPTSSEDAVLTLQLTDEGGQVIAEQALETAAIAHNQVARLTFEPQPSSAGQPYRLFLRGSADNPVSVWGYSLDVYEDGHAEAVGPNDTGRPVPQDLGFTTRYELSWLDALTNVAATLFYEGLLFLLALLFLPLPGVLALLAYRLHVQHPEDTAANKKAYLWDPAAWWGSALALGVAIWPLLWLWATLFGLRWQPWSLALLLAGGWLVAGLLWWRIRQPEPAGTTATPLTRPWRWSHLALLGILLLGFAARLLAVRDVAFLPWVDASRHGLITAVMTQSGQVIRSYAPYLPVERFPYHFGFHSLSSSLALLSGWPLERLLLYLGQLFNGLVPLTMFAALWLFTRRQSAGLLGAFLVALPFFFPAYYTTWGRMTQLTAVLLLPVLLALTWWLIRGPARWQEAWWLVGILLAGLFLIHVRVFVYFLPFPLIAWLFSRLRRTGALLAAAALAFGLALPHLLRVLQDANPERPLGGTIANYNEFPTSYVTTGWEQQFLIAAGLGLLPLVIGLSRRRPWTILPLALLTWAASLLALLSVDRFGIPLPALFNLNSMVIILFVPLAIYLAVIAGVGWRWLAGQPVIWQWLGYGLSGALLAAMLIFGLRQQITILNEQTILARPADMAGITWIEGNLPPDALLAVNSWRWLGETWAAADGGAWILPLTGRSVTTPPIDHIYNAALFEQVRSFNEGATAVTDWSDPAQAQWLSEQGVTHLFIGQRGGFFDPATLARNPQLVMLYGKHGVFVFAVREELG